MSRSFPDQDLTSKVMQFRADPMRQAGDRVPHFTVTTISTAADSAESQAP